MRSICKLLRANLRSQKSECISIVLLMLIVTFSYAVTLSNNRNIEKTIREDFAAEQIGDWIFVYAEEPAQSDLEILRQHPEITGIRTQQILNLRAPIRCGDTECADLEMIRCEKQTEHVFNAKLNGFQTHIPLHSGEILLDYRLHSEPGLAVGKAFTLCTAAGWNETFTVAGYYQEVADFSSGIGLVCQADFDRLCGECAPASAPDCPLYRSIRLHTDVQAGTDLRALSKTLKQECSLFQDAVSVITKTDLHYYASLIAQTGTRLVAVYTVLLLAVVMIVIRSSIGTAVETEYRNLGILKAVGFDRARLRTVWSLQYTAAVLTGTVLGLLISIPATSLFGGLFTHLSSIRTENTIALGRCSLTAAAILLLCTGFVALETVRIGRISPVRAISGGYGDIYFASRLHTRIRQRGLHFFLALRQLISQRRNNLGSTLIVAMLVFFLCTSAVFAGGINPDLFLTPTGDIELRLLSSSEVLPHLPEIGQIASQYDPNAEVLLWSSHIAYAEDEQIMLNIYSSDEMFTAPLAGRLPRYDNEIAVTEIFAQKIGKDIGDTVSVQHGRAQADFVITGLIQSMMYRGGVLEISFEGGRRLGVQAPDLAYIRLRDPAQKTAVTAAVNAQMQGFAAAKEIEPGSYLRGLRETAGLIVRCVLIAVYGISVLFAAIVVTMLCRKTFRRERTDLGILRAEGFSVPMLRLQFALRFLMIAAAGSALGCVCAALFSGRLLSLLMRMIGLSRFAAAFTWDVFVLPAAAICAAFFVFAYLASRCVRTVAVRELVTE